MNSKYTDKPVTLEGLLSGGSSDITLVKGGLDAEITSVEYDSRRVSEGGLFVAVQGLKSDGHEYIDAVLEKGAAAVVVSRDRAEEFADRVNGRTSLLSATDTRSALSFLSAGYYGNPSGSMKVIGITGTNGKTSITYMLESILRAGGFNPGIIGTVNYRWSGKELPAPNTTPESTDLQRILADMRMDGVDVAVMEVSSHALELKRADHIEFDIAVFTNLTRDHLDFHENFENYFSSKKRLFALLESGSKTGRTGIINADDKYGALLLEDTAGYTSRICSFGLEKNAAYRPVKGSIANTIDGLSYEIEEPDPGTAIDLNLSGTFSVYNSIAAYAAAREMGLPAETIQKGLRELHTVPGRFEVLKSGLGFSVIVDYAHTGDALLKLLEAVNELGHSRVITVFGCGGDRDRSKRPIMGAVAERNSDLAIVTSDNPRTEDPDAIIQDITGGMSNGGYEIISDRREAIRRAVMEAGRGDIIVIAGKGHEDYQILGTTRIHFDDRETAAVFIKERETL